MVKSSGNLFCRRNRICFCIGGVYLMRHIHLIGIGGSGLSAIARILLENGYTVSGSDRADTPLTRELNTAGVKVYIGHDACNIQGADLILRSSAVNNQNPEVAAALAAGIPVMKRSDFLPILMAQKTCIAIAGTHGKTTTTAMAAWTLNQLGADPSYIIGGVSKNLNGNAHAGKGSIFVIEADEYDRMFLGLQPEIAVITFMEHDHPDCYPTPQIYRDAFATFVSQIKPGGVLLVCADQSATAALADALPSGCRGLTYGRNEQADYHLTQIEQNSSGGMTFKAVFRPTGEELPVVALQVPGEHNVRNALAVLAIVHQQGLLLSRASKALAEFTGTGRRFDLRGEADGVIVIDDYAHHPTEIKTTLAAARSRYPQKRIWAVWQPHTYSRTQSLLNAFASSFDDADKVIVSEVYAAREKDPGFSSRQVVEEMNHPGKVFIPELEGISDYLKDALQPGDVLLVLSAGDADQISVQVLIGLKDREAAHGK
jgi:UDP-N-acetylmuramate--alanine ligase